MRIFKKKKILENVFKKRHPKKVLVSYIVEPFRHGMSFSHTNTRECYNACEVFDELGYRVDVVEYLANVTADELVGYDVVYGFGRAFNASLENDKIVSIFYGTGCCTLYSNKVSLERAYSFYKKTGVLALSSARYTDLDYLPVLYFSDLIIPLGNDFVADTYRVFGVEQNIKKTDCFFYDSYDIDLEEKNFEAARKNFLWFGSTGLLHKGLDIVLEVFKKRPELNLFICGANRREKEFYQYYKDELNNKIANIKNLEFVNIFTDEFKKLMNECVAMLSPSVSEGGAAAVLCTMANGGLIPIVSATSGLDIDEYGFVLEDITPEAVEKMIDKLLNTPAAELLKIAKKAKQDTRKRYTVENHKNALKKLIKETLEVR